jgi:hypothetical protein
MAKQISLNLDEVNGKRMSIFARHETFHPRFGWIKKGFDRAAEDPGIFLREDAPVCPAITNSKFLEAGTLIPSS